MFNAEVLPIILWLEMKVKSPKGKIEFPGFIQPAKVCMAPFLPYVLNGLSERQEGEKEQVTFYFSLFKV